METGVTVGNYQKQQISHVLKYNCKAVCGYRSHMDISTTVNIPTYSLTHNLTCQLYVRGTDMKFAKVDHVPNG